MYILDQLADVSRNYFDLVVREIKIGQRRQLQKLPRDSAEIVALQMDGTKFGKSTWGNREREIEKEKERGEREKQTERVTYELNTN